MHKNSAYKTFIHKTENHIKVNNEHGSDKFNAITAKKSRKNMVDAGSDKKSNRSKAEVFQLTHQPNIDASGSTLSAMQRGKRCITNIFVKITKKKDHQKLQKYAILAKIYYLSIPK